MKIVETKPVGCQPINIWCIDQAAEAPDLRKPDIVQQENDDVRRVRVRFLVCGPPFLGVFVALRDDATETLDLFFPDAVDHHDPGFIGTNRNLRFAVTGLWFRACG